MSFETSAVSSCSKDVDDNGGGEIYMVHMSAWGHTRDASTSVKVGAAIATRELDCLCRFHVFCLDFG